MIRVRILKSTPIVVIWLTLTNITYIFFLHKNYTVHESYQKMNYYHQQIYTEGNFCQHLGNATKY